jgi:MFS family permease
MRSDPDAEGAMYREAIRSPRFWCMVLIVTAFPFCMKGVYTQLQPFFTDLGFTAIFAASLMSVISFFQSMNKPVLGWLNDKLSIRGLFSIATGCFFFGILLITMTARFPGSRLLTYSAAVIFGLACATPTMISPLMTSAMFGRKDFMNIYGTVSSFWHIGPTIAPLISAFVFDSTGSYVSVFVAYMLAIFIAFILGNWLLAPTGRAKEGSRKESGRRKFSRA